VELLDDLHACADLPVVKPKHEKTDERRLSGCIFVAAPCNGIDRSVQHLLLWVKTTKPNH
jgi:hypothetical protein